MLRRKYIFNTIEQVFRKYGYLPLETPAMENLSTLTGKYGEEGDRLIFKVLNSGDAWRSVSGEVKQQLAKGEEVHPGKLAAELCEKALRYDLTVPFARYVAQHRNELAFPFKRYQIQPVWRADRPQKGRYREFYQCDADVIGSKSLLNEVELILLTREVFDKLGLKVRLLINNRKVLTGLAQLFDATERLAEFIAILDKFDKIGLEIVEEYRRRNFSENTVKRMEDFLLLKGAIAEAPRGGYLRNMMYEYKIEIGLIGFEELDYLMKTVEEATGGSWQSYFDIDVLLARGLDYYTGAIFEVKAAEGPLSVSIAGGGRYDDLTGIFGLNDMSGVGISFGADRIYDVLLDLGKYPAELGIGTRVLFANFGGPEAMHALQQLRVVRQAGIAAELYPDAAKMGKQFKYADDKGIPFVAIIGANELKDGTIMLKDMKSGEQRAVREEEFLTTLGQE